MTRRSATRRAHRRVLRDARERTAAAPGTAPGTLRIDPAATPPQIRVFQYSVERREEHRVDSVAQISRYLSPDTVTWVDVAGFGDAAVLQELAELFGLHPLALEDVVHTNQRAKVELYGDQVFMIARMPRTNSEHVTEQLSLFVKPGLVLTFVEDPGDCFEPVRERIRHGRGRLRSKGADYLAYALVDSTIDAYFPVLDHLGDRLGELEESILERPSQETMIEVHQLRRDLISLRKAIAPHREAVNSLLRQPVDPFTDETLIFLRDCYDHTIRLVEIIEGYREFAASLMELYLTSISNRTNDVMKVLTMISTIFIPLSFIAGLYGMNFDPSLPGNMPELRTPYAYPLLLGVMVLVAGAFFWVFRRKGWL